MTTRYVDGTDGDDAYNGLAAVFDGTNGPKKTLNGCEDTPVQAGDLVHVRSGTYRETLTVDVSGSAGSDIEYRGDYTGVVWSGGGVVRITGSDNDQTATRAFFIVATNKDYRTFDGFVCDTVSSIGFNLTTVSNWRLNALYLTGSTGGIQFVGNCRNNTVSRLFGFGFLAGGSVFLFLDAATERDDTGNIVENCLCMTGRDGGYAFQSIRVGGVTVRNSAVLVSTGAFNVETLAAGQTITVNNCLLAWCNAGFIAGAAGMITENYNNVYQVSFPRSNVSTGANSTAYPPLFDTRWFFEAVNGGSMVTPFDLASYSQLVNVAGTSPTTTDMRGTSVIGAQREWGSLEFDPDLDIEAGPGGGGAVSVSPWRGNIG